MDAPVHDSRPAAVDWIRTLLAGAEAALAAPGDAGRTHRLGPEVPPFDPGDRSLRRLWPALHEAAVATHAATRRIGQRAHLAERNPEHHDDWTTLVLEDLVAALRSCLGRAEAIAADPD